LRMSRIILSATIALALIFVFGSLGISDTPGITTNISHAASPGITGKEMPGTNNVCMAGAGFNIVDAVDREADVTVAGDKSKNAAVPLATVAPDLIVQKITWSPENPSIGDMVIFSVTVKNQGDDKAGPSQVAYYIDDIYITSDSVDTLFPGDTAEHDFTWIAQPGAHTVKAIADFNNEIAESDETNNGNTFAIAPTASDLVIQGFSWTPQNPSEGETIKFHILIKNQGNSMAAASVIDFHIDGSSMGKKDVGRINAGDTLIITYNWIVQMGLHNIKGIVDCDNQLSENDEANNEKASYFAPAIPDLVIENIIWSPENPSKNDDVTFTVNLKNQGNGKADYFHVEYYVDDTYLNSAFVDPIDAGGTANLTFTWEARSGSHSIKAVADSNTWVAESNEDNNEKIIYLSTPAPDLIIQDITWSPENPSVTDSVTFTVTLKNQGSGRAENSRLALYIAGVYTGHQSVQEIDPGVEVTKTFEWIAEPGAYAVKAVADLDDDNSESDETNNNKAVTFITMIPDLVVKEITWLPEEPPIGTMVTYTVTVENQGSGGAADFRIAYYFDGLLLSSKQVGFLEAGATDNETFTALTEMSSHDVRVVADFTNNALESDETNNEKTVTFFPITPDLAIRDISWFPANPSVGDTLTFTAMIENRGNDIAAYSIIAYHVDGSSKGYHDVQMIEVGATTVDTFAWTVEAGTHTIQMVVDANGTIVESDETNNAKTITFPPPDLAIQNIAWSPGNPSENEEVTLTVTVKNQGHGRANQSSITCYIDDTLIGKQGVPEIEVGITGTKTFTWYAQLGSHEVKVIADEANDIVEIDETNNEKTSTLLTLTSDLAIEDIAWSPEEPSENEEVTLTVTIKNQGSGKAKPSRIACYIDDSLMEEQEVPEIGAGATATKTFTWSAQLGSHEVKIIADEANDIVEIDETNNEKTSTLLTLTSDLIIEDIAWSPGNPSENEEVTLTVTIKNQGSGKAKPSRIACYIDDSLIGEQGVPEIGAGATATKTFTWSAQLGLHYIKAVADNGQTLAESDESNNVERQILSLTDAKGNPGNTKETSIPVSSTEDGNLGNVWYLVIVAGVIFVGWLVFGLMKFWKK